MLEKNKETGSVMMQMSELKPVRESLTATGLTVLATGHGWC